MADARCAVVGCTERGRPQVCPYDGRYHHHGRIHYEGPKAPAGITFHADHWDLMCDSHYSVLNVERLRLLAYSSDTIMG